MDAAISAVLPVSSSASGLVWRAVDAVLAHEGPLVASGVVDVAVRFDAYTAGPGPLEWTRGSREPLPRRPG